MQNIQSLILTSSRKKFIKDDGQLANLEGEKGHLTLEKLDDFIKVKA
jgi:hypothetical protein